MCVTLLLYSSKSFSQPIAKRVVFFELRCNESDGEPGLGLNSFWREEIDVPDLVRALAEVSRLDQALFEKTLQDVIDLPQADPSVLGELALVDDRLSVEGVENFEGFLGMFHENPSQ
jgi:hypothetical protein